MGWDENQADKQFNFPNLSLLFLSTFLYTKTFKRQRIIYYVH